VTDLETLMRNPGTAAAARLSGCKNLVPVRPGGAPGTVEVPDWGLTLRCAAPWRAEAAALGLRGVRPAEEGEIDNVFLCQVLRVTEDLDSLQAALRPQGAAPGSPPLWMELSKGTPPPAGLLRVRVSPADLLLLE
jgi:molybdate transport system ATP-binding protein